MKRRIFIFGLVCLSGLLSACSEEANTDGGGTVVAFTFSGIGADLSGSVPSTRGDKLPVGTSVRVVAYKGTVYVADHTYKADASGNLVADGDDMRLIEDTYDFYAVSPALAIASKSTSGPTFNVAQGVDFASVKKSCKVTAYIGSNSSAKCTVPLGELTRKCAKLTFAIDVATDVPFTVTKTVITEAALSVMPGTLTATGATLNAGSGSTTLTLPASVFDTDTTNKRKASGSVVALPKTSAAFNLTMKAQFNGVTSVTTLFPATAVPNMSFDAGKEYTFTVKLTKDKLGKPAIGLWLTISQWSMSDQDFGMGGVPTGPVTTQLLGYWTDFMWSGDAALGGTPTGPVLTGVSGWWTNYGDNSHLGSDDINSND